MWKKKGYWKIKQKHFSGIPSKLQVFICWYVYLFANLCKKMYRMQLVVFWCWIASLFPDCWQVSLIQVSYQQLHGREVTSQSFDFWGDPLWDGIIHPKDETLKHCGNVKCHYCHWKMTTNCSVELGLRLELKGKWH